MRCGVTLAQAEAYATYGLISAENVSVPAGANSKRRSHWLATFSPFALAGANVQFFAARIAASAKYLLGPGASNAASVTLPEGSTFTFTLTRTLPRIVFRAPCETSGMT